MSSIAIFEPANHPQNINVGIPHLTVPERDGANDGLLSQLHLQLRLLSAVSLISDCITNSTEGLLSDLKGKGRVVSDVHHNHSEP